MHFFFSDGQGRVLINTQWQAQSSQREMLLWPDHWTTAAAADGFLDLSQDLLDSALAGTCLQDIYLSRSRDLIIT